MIDPGSRGIPRYAQLLTVAILVAIGVSHIVVAIRDWPLGDMRGTGLGLAGSRAVVEQLGGSITVESVIDKGATFTVRLPITPEPNPET